MQVVLSNKAKKHYLRLPSIEQKKIKRKLQSLTEYPFSGKKLSGDLEGDRSLRVWPYRIIYSINIKMKRVEVSNIMHRQGVYK
ncbi:MAG: type II toxin-antitoxin system RelE family toxin [Candidatus Roizmanbacteria bacterium]